MITTERLNDMEYVIKRNSAVIVDLDFIRDIRALMAENVELHDTLDKVKSSISDATKMLDEVLE